MGRRRPQQIIEAKNNVIDLTEIPEIREMVEAVEENKRLKAELERLRYIDIPATKWKDFLGSVANISHLMKRDGRARFNTKNLVVELY